MKYTASIEIDTTVEFDVPEEDQEAFEEKLDAVMDALKANVEKTSGCKVTARVLYGGVTWEGDTE